MESNPDPWKGSRCSHLKYKAHFLGPLTTPGRGSGVLGLDFRVQALNPKPQGLRFSEWAGGQNQVYLSTVAGGDFHGGQHGRDPRV